MGGAQLNGIEVVDMTQTLGVRIRQLRMENGYTQVRLATQLGLTKQAVSKWENDLAYPDILLLPALARLLDTTIDEMLTF